MKAIYCTPQLTAPFCTEYRVWLSPVFSHNVRRSFVPPKTYFRPARTPEFRKRQLLAILLIAEYIKTPASSGLRSPLFLNRDFSHMHIRFWITLFILDYYLRIFKLGFCLPIWFDFVVYFSFHLCLHLCLITKYCAAHRHDTQSKNMQIRSTGYS